MFKNSYVMEDLVIERVRTSTEDIAVIISAKNCTCDELEAYILKAGGQIKHKFDIINAVAAYLPSIGVKSAAREHFIHKIFLDDKVYKSMDIASITVGSNYANEHGYTGKNVTIAIADTGISPHNDLIRPSNRIVGFKDFVNNKSAPYDDDGHGTHVAGIVSGNAFSSRGKHMGIAPDSSVVGVKVLGKDGSGSISDVIAGIQWIIENKKKYNIKVLTLSLGTRPKTSYKEDPLCQAVDKATIHGITVVAAAGNNGPDKKTIDSPANSPNIISVGACDDRSTDNPSNVLLADFSSRGPTLDGLNKPDILAPGVNINSLSNHNNNYHRLSGTSMSAPMIAGCVALLLEKNPELKPREIKRIITSTALHLPFTQTEQGAGVLNLREIVNSTPYLPKLNQLDSNAPYNESKASNLKTGFNNWFWVVLILLIVLSL
ncbi:MAG: S8 family peptidase [Alkaliphilus sp.]